MNDDSLWEYWNEHKEDISLHRSWAKSTLVHYSSMMTRLYKSAPSVIDGIPISSVTFSDCLNALVAVRESRDGDALQSSTVDSYLSLLRDIFAYAESFHHAKSPFTGYVNTMLKRAGRAALHGTVKSSSTLSRIYPGREETELKEKLARRRGIRRSLSIAEMQSIYQLISDHLTEDGRYIGLAISLFTGLRPNECRALRWEDYHHIPGSFGRYFEIHHVLTPDNAERKRPKTQNGFRSIPVHEQLETLLFRWQEHFYRSTPHPKTVDRPSGLPPVRYPGIENMKGYICCKELHYGEPCRYKDFAEFAKEKLFSGLDKELVRMGNQELELSKSSKSPLYERDENLTLYVLRRNFWTWMSYGTSCTKYEKLYVMGHEMKRDGRNLRPQFAAPDKLERIRLCMNQFVIMPYPASRNVITYPLAWGRDPMKSVSLSEAGYAQVHIRREAVQQRSCCKIVVRTLEAGDYLHLELLTPIEGKYRIHVHTSLSEEKAPSLNSEVLITETSTLLAAERVYSQTHPSETKDSRPD